MWQRRESSFIKHSVFTVFYTPVPCCCQNWTLYARQQIFPMTVLPDRFPTTKISVQLCLNSQGSLSAMYSPSSNIVFTSIPIHSCQTSSHMKSNMVTVHAFAAMGFHLCTGMLSSKISVSLAFFRKSDNGLINLSVSCKQSHSHDIWWYLLPYSHGIRNRCRLPYNGYCKLCSVDFSYHSAIWMRIPYCLECHPQIRSLVSTHALVSQQE